MYSGRAWSMIFTPSHGMAMLPLTTMRGFGGSDWILELSSSTDTVCMAPSLRTGTCPRHQAQRHTASWPAQLALRLLAAFLVVVFFAAVFLAGAFLAAAFLAGAFVAESADFSVSASSRISPDAPSGGLVLVRFAFAMR